MSEEFAYKPLYDNVVLETIRDTHAGEIELARGAQEKRLTKATVLAVGPGKLNIDTGQHLTPKLKMGDVVFINKLMGMSIRISSRKEYIVLKEDEIRVLMTTG